jgi:hypothetical protein
MYSETFTNDVDNRSILLNFFGSGGENWYVHCTAKNRLIWLEFSLIESCDALKGFFHVSWANEN